MDDPKRELANKMEEHTARNPKVVTLEVQLDTNVNGVREQTAEQRKADAATAAAAPVCSQWSPDTNKESRAQGKSCQGKFHGTEIPGDVSRQLKSKG